MSAAPPPRTHEGRIAVVTGGGRGIGAAIATELAARGARVAALDLAPGEPPPNGIALPCDVADRASVDAACAEAERALGGPPDILVNNAGVSPKRDGQPSAIHAMDAEEWDRVVAVNLTGAWNLTRRLSPAMVANRRGRIVMQASVAGRTYFPPVGCHYAATKAALIGLAKHLAGELGPHGITVNALAPGRIETPMARTAAPGVNDAIAAVTPLRRLGTPEEVAAACAFLTGPDAGFVTGVVLDVSGGWLMT